MKITKRILTALLAVSLSFAALPAPVLTAADTETQAEAWAEEAAAPQETMQSDEQAAPQTDEYSTTILFTHDMHSHFLPAADETGKISGGFARLATLLDEQRALHPDALTLDAGDFSMGSLFQTVYATDALELRMMGALGYDATTFGNHEFDYRMSGLASMLEAAKGSGEPVPQIVESNYFLPDTTDPAYDETDAAVQQALDDYGVEEYTLLDRNGITYGIFGIMGEDSAADAPESTMVLTDAAEAAQDMVDKIKAEADPDKPLFIICLSHSGTDPDHSKSEDELLAENVDGIDVIISAHSHTVLEEPLDVNDTLIVSAGCYTANLGVLTVDWSPESGRSGYTYELLPVDDSVADEPEIAARIETYKDMVTEDYLSLFGMDSFDQVLGTNDVEFDTVDDVYNYHRESGLGDLIADSYVYAVTQADEPDAEPVTMAVTASGVIRGSFLAGDVTVSDVFNVSSLGIGTDELAGYPLVEAWLTGKEIKAACEVDASVQPLMPAAQLHMSGISFTWNDHRMIFNKVSEAHIQNADGSLSDLEDDRLYRIVTGLYCAQMLSTVKEQSFGLISIVPKYADGTEITDFDDCIIHDQNGNEIKEWYALASYIESFDDGKIPDRYSNANSTSRKIEKDSWSPAALLVNANWITYAVIGSGILVIALIVLVIILIRRHHRKKAQQNAA